MLYIVNVCVVINGSYEQICSTYTIYVPYHMCLKHTYFQSYACCKTYVIRKHIRSALTHVLSNILFILIIIPVRYKTTVTHATFLACRNIQNIKHTCRGRQLFFFFIGGAGKANIFLSCCYFYVCMKLPSVSP